MKNRKLSLAIAGTLLFSLGVAAGITAQTLSDSPYRMEQKRTDLSGAPNMEVIASVVELKPGESTPVHMHHGIEVVYVIQGGMVQAPGKPAVMNQTGATSVNLREVKHSGTVNVGTEPIKLFTVHIVDKGKPLYDFSK